MKRFSTSLGAAAVFGVSLAGAPLAWAQDHPTDDAHPDQHAPAHPPAKAPHPAPKPVVHHTVVHRTVVVKKTVVNEHVNEHVTEHVTARPGPVVAGGPERGPIVAPRWHQGDRFSGNRVVFTDYDRYHVRRPPAGYEWVQDGNELVLISLADGLIGDTFFITVP